MTQQTTLLIEGMTCGSCATRVKQALTAIAGVSAASVDVRNRVAVIDHDPGKATGGELARAVSAAGYPATEKPDDHSCCAL